jgi:hypothetical protein
MKKIKLKLNVDLAGKKAGAIVTVEIDRDKVIVDPYWRRRFKDSDIDNCVEIVKEETVKKEIKKESKS